ncbi:DNA-binding transcriptional regulator, LysR family [Anaerovirgula multivorans]|uniref:DNA-binding transcriptional regulator, LysR family n=1 Tax=Anaerovirgula multivorans TaxID=312168 RepID=A0A239L6T2_9FIRM|nr:LysR family transcriptional regulator [Anaerovirgula multivorans]SNT26151.1 DNA-binding transcriptional regulator, LysR family [Anaerovirgula multivorans]
MIFKNYEYFITIAEEGSVSRAAQKLYISQPSLSKYLKKLEDNVGESLFYRDSYPLRLTKAGELYLSYVKDIMEKEKCLINEFSYLHNSESGHVHMGITVWRSSILLPRVLPTFKQRYPRITLHISEGSHQHLASLLEHEKVDFSITHFPNNYFNFSFEKLYSERILFCVNKKHPLLSDIKPLSQTEINTMNSEEFRLFYREPFILLKSGQNIRDMTQSYLDKQNISPNILLETSNIVTAVNMVKINMGVTFVPEAVLCDKESHEQLMFFSIDDSSFCWDVGISYKTEYSISKPVRLFIECLKELSII